MSNMLKGTSKMLAPAGGDGLVDVQLVHGVHLPLLQQQSLYTIML